MCHHWYILCTDDKATKTKVDHHRQNEVHSSHKSRQVIYNRQVYLQIIDSRLSFGPIQLRLPHVSKSGRGHEYTWLVRSLPVSFLDVRTKFCLSQHVYHNIIIAGRTEFDIQSLNFRLSQTSLSSWRRPSPVRSGRCWCHCHRSKRTVMRTVPCICIIAYRYCGKYAIWGTWKNMYVLWFQHVHPSR